MHKWNNIERFTLAVVYYWNNKPALKRNFYSRSSINFVTYEIWLLNNRINVLEIFIEKVLS